ncbi:MAG TPA: c-type cytochrome [Acidimicrobiales bacterium]|nr:c-type cytochrome [Acidimicrobiales bacterium]
MSRLFGNRYLLPAMMVAAMGLGGVLSLASGASATTTPSSSSGVGGISSGGGVGAGNFSSGVSLPPGVGSPSYLGGPKNSGGANASVRIYRTVGGKRHLVAYGSSAITYKTPPASYVPLGQALFAQNCSSCHGADAQGSAIAPNLVGVGPATVDFWVSTGRMPAATTNVVQANRKPPRLSPKQALEVAAFVNSLDPAVPYVPYPNLKGANLADGADLFSLNCAACHTITGMGDALALSTFSPSLHAATAQQVAEAIRTGPANMPRFTGNLLDSQLRDVVAYVTESIQHPADPGGSGLGGIGPVAEGFIGLLFGVGGLALICFWIGDRA